MDHTHDDTLATRRQHHPPQERLGRELVRVMGGIHRRGWCDGTSGNFSCVIRAEPLKLLMAPSGVQKGAVGPEELIEVDAQGRVVAGQGRASAETALHLAIVAVTGAGAVLHTHSLAATLLSGHGPCLERISPSRRGEGENPAAEAAAETAARDRGILQGATGSAGLAAIRISDLEMLKGLEGISTHQTTVSLPILPNDQDMERLALQARSVLRSAPHGLLIAGHGLYAWGKDLKGAQRHLEILEFLMELRWRQLLLPVPHPLPACEGSTAADDG
jgi:methylthioribulose-1-phosphate dehydratase